MRALGAAGVKGCIHGCLYCFTQADTFIRCPRFDEKRVRDLQNEFRELDYIQPSIDTELLMVEDWKKFIDNMAAVGKSISFATKSIVTDEQLNYLTNINNVLISAGRFLNVGVTIVKLKEWDLIEPKAPSPEERIKTLKRLYFAGIKTTVLVRPLIPTLSDSEIEELVKLTHKYCEGYLAGPLYINDKMKEYFRNQKLDINTKMIPVDWQEGTPTLEALVSEKKEALLSQVAEKYNKKLFDGNTEAMNYLKSQLKSIASIEEANIVNLRSENVITIYMIDKSTKEICLLFDRYHGRWIPIGGGVFQNEDDKKAASRIIEEKFICNVDIKFANHIKLSEEKKIEQFVLTPSEFGSNAFCNVREIVNSVQKRDPHIHMSKVFILLLESQLHLEAHDRDKVMSFEWFKLNQIKDVNTFENVKFICNELSKMNV